MKRTTVPRLVAFAIMAGAAPLMAAAEPFTMDLCGDMMRPSFPR